MSRRFVLVVMMLAMVWQSAVLAQPGSTVNLLADLEHAALHLQEEGHHHHDDGSFHLDDSQASTLHLLSDNLTTPTALPPAVLHDFPPSVFAPPGALNDAGLPDPFLDGPLRPPRRCA